MLYWITLAYPYLSTPAERIRFARAAIATNRSMGRSIYHPVRVGMIIIGN